MAELGLLDTSVVIDLETVPTDQLPEQSAVAAVTMAELAAGPHAAKDAVERARRQDRLQRAEVTWEPLPFDAEAARWYGLLYAAMKYSGQSSRARFADLLIAATAAAHRLPVYTRNPGDFAALTEHIKIVPV
jgi:predicted nucleic acid-binding protein